MFEGTRKFLKREVTNKTYQIVIRIDKIFRGFIVKDQFNNNQNYEENKKHNKVIIKLATNFHMKYQAH